MRKWNKVTALLLTVAVAAMTIGGCGSEKVPETPVSSTEEAKTEAVSEPIKIATKPMT